MENVREQTPAFRPMASDQPTPAEFLGSAVENGAQQLGDYEGELGAALHTTLGVLLHPPAGARDLRFICAWTRMPTTTKTANSNGSA